MRYIVTTCLLIPAVLLPLTRITSAARRPTVWYNCYLKLDAAHPSHILQRACYTVPIQKKHTRQTGWHITRTHVSARLIHSVRYPTFAAVKPAPAPTPTAPQGQSMWLFVTGYSWGCGAGYGVTSSGTVPGVGTVASNVLPLGAHIYVPSLRYQGVVLDRGAPLDLFAPDCATTYGYTGLRQVIVF